MLEAHILAILLLGVSSFIIGSIPLKFARWTNHPFLLSLLLCLGGGILLATSILHMLAEVRSQLPEFAELIFCGGFLFLYAVDEAIHLCVQDVHSSTHNSHVSTVGKKSRRLKSSTQNESRRSSKISTSSSSDGLMKCNFHKHQTSYGTMEKLPTRARFDSVSKSFQDVDEHVPADYIPVSDLGDNELSPGRCCRKHERENRFIDFHMDPIPLNYQNSSYHETAWKPSTEVTTDSSETLSERELCHIEIQKPCGQRTSSLLGLLAALLIHAILEGCSIGVQNKSNEVLLVLAAVATHKLVLAFCLGMELVTAGFDGFQFVSCLTAFSVGAPIGIGIGASLTHSTDGVFFIEAPLQALAGGSLLYVAVFEILPRERYKWQHNADKRYATFSQMLMVIIGFALIALLNTFIGNHEHNTPAVTTNPP